MNVTELRIGNYVNAINRISKLYLTEDVFFEVLEIGSEFVFCEFSIAPEGMKKLPVAHQSNLSPISLTEEWLIKLGFQKTPNGFTIRIKSGFLFVDLEEDLFSISNSLSEYMRGEYYECMGNPIKYVHQLQNLFFGLTNDELSIKKSYV